MIKVTGLQIGNLFRDKLTGELLSVCGLDEEKELIEFKVINRENFPLPAGWQAEPIELTPETLQACGFEQNTRKQDYYSFSELDYDVRICRLWINKHQKRIYVDQIKYLHQLQNLYPFLTGETLEVKL